MLALLHPGCYTRGSTHRRGTCRAIPTTRWRNAPGICPMHRPVRPTLDNSTRVDVISSILPKYLLDVVANLPANVDRGKGAGLVSWHLFEVSDRTLEAWPIPARYVNGRAHVSTVVLFEVAFQKWNSAPVVMGGRRAKARGALDDSGERSGHLLTGSDGTEQCTTIVKRVGATRRRSIGP
jgi:hypothetical protein